MSRETGLVELQVRLPCKHVVGSGCIAVWLGTNNSCPMCRRVFFPAHREQYNQDIDVLDQEEDYQDSWVDQEEEEDTEEMLLENCRIFSIQLLLDSTTIRIAQMITKNTWRIYPFCELIDNVCDDNAVRLIGLAIYIASSFTGHPRSPREISEVRDVDGNELGVNGDQIRDHYHLIHGQRERLIDDVVIESLEGRDIVWPSLDPNDESDDHIESSRDISAVRPICDTECAHFQVSPLMVDLAQHIVANVIRAGFHIFNHPENSEHLWDWQIAAVSIYIASHLLGQPLSRRSVQDRETNEYPDLRSTCIMVRDKCDPLVRDDFCGTRGIQLSWESLEADIGEESSDWRHANQDEEDAPQIEASSLVSRTERLNRTELLTHLCDVYCLQLPPLSLGTLDLAERLAGRFSSVTVLDGRCLESIAAACVSIACFCGNNYKLHYTDLAAITKVSARSIYTTHLMMAQEVVLGRVHVRDIDESAMMRPDRFRNTLPHMPIWRLSLGPTIIRTCGDMIYRVSLSS